MGRWGIKRKGERGVGTGKKGNGRGLRKGTKEKDGKKEKEKYVRRKKEEKG